MVGPKPGQAIVLFDGECPFCLKTLDIVKRFDWRKKLFYQNSRDRRNLPKADVPLDPDKLLEEMHLLTPDRKRVFTGFDAFRWMAFRIPLFVFLVPFLYLPGVPRLGRKAYLWIAKNRFKLVPCYKGMCALKPARA